MKCAEVRQLVSPYLDSELDAKTSLEVERHLESCPECAGLFAAEGKFDERISRCLRSGQRTASLWKGIEARLQPAPGPGWLRPLWRPASLAAALVLFAVIGFLVWSRSGPLDLALAVEECHSAHVDQLTEPQFTGAVPAEVRAKLGQWLDADSFSFRPTSSIFHAKGARYCHVKDVPVALILGDYQKVPMSLVVFKQEELAHFPEAEARLATGETIVCCRAGRYQFAARLVKDHVVCLIADAPRPVLENLLKSVSDAG
jgi:anti-sigma factor RsiW